MDSLLRLRPTQRYPIVSIPSSWREGEDGEKGVMEGKICSFIWRGVVRCGGGYFQLEGV